jgi:hypothetical protein
MVYVGCGTTVYRITQPVPKSVLVRKRMTSEGFCKTTFRGKARPWKGHPLVVTRVSTLAAALLSQTDTLSPFQDVRSKKTHETEMTNPGGAVIVVVQSRPAG